MKDFKEIILGYYGSVDSGNIEDAVDIFSADAAYFRAGVKFEGLDKIKDFYFNLRKLVGIHKIHDFLVNGNKVFVSGVFEGKTGKGEEVILEFRDEFEFENGKVTRRKTFVDEGFDKTI